MIFPLEHRILIRGCAAHKAAGLGCAVDYVADFVPLFSPVDGRVTLFEERQGGDWIMVTDSDGLQWEMAHLSERLVKTGDIVTAGQHIGTTGNSGTVTTGPHLHLQIIRGYPARIDPEPLLINAPLPMAYDTTHIPAEGSLVRIGSSPLRYGYILRGKRFEFSQSNDVLMEMYQREKFGPNPVIRLTPAEWETIPKSDGVKF